MVQSQWSGVAFSINPVTGRNEFVIEAVKGSGVQLVQDGVKPFRWTWCQDSWDYDIEPEEDIKEVLESLVDGIKKLQKAFGGAVDIEWAYDGKQAVLPSMPPSDSQRVSNHLFQSHLPRSTARNDQTPGLVGKHPPGEQCLDPAA